MKIHLKKDVLFYFGVLTYETKIPYSYTALTLKIVQ